MRAFNAPKNSYTLKLNHRGLINDFFSLVLDLQDTDTQKSLMRLLDKYAKLKKEVFEDELEKLGLKKESQILHDFMSAKTIQDLQQSFVSLAGSESFTEFTNIMNSLESLGYNGEFQFSGDLIRGFDYYDGIIFEMFDNNQDNPRALFG
jgi:histidyl-tRNA synthetase